MKTKVTEVIIAILLGILIPILLVAMLQDKVSIMSNLPSSIQTKPYASTSERLITILKENGTIVDMPIEDYVLSVVLCEMPADFELEALKAQAVVARTYALRRSLKSEKHANSAVCADSACCQGFCSIEDYLESGGTKSDIERIKQAIDATSGLVLVYENELIDATYFSCSGGSTEDAVAVWGTDIPYLRSVESPGEERATHYVDTVRYDVDEFAEKLGIKLRDDTTIKIEMITHTNGGGVETIKISGRTYRGTQIRKQLKLRSTAFLISVLGDTVTITTKGYGHRVGMSQYGADAMATTGSTFQQILYHYYQGTQLIPFDID